MKLSEISLRDIIPENMRDDNSIKGFTAAFDHILSTVMEKKRMVNLIENVDALTSSQMDQVAESMDIPWYGTALPVHRKQELLRDFMTVSYIAGTKKSIEQTMADIFGYAEIAEWWEYDGPQFEFRVSVANAETTEQVKRAIETLERIRPARATYIIRIAAPVNLEVGASVKKYREKSTYCGTLQSTNILYKRHCAEIDTKLKEQNIRVRVPVSGISGTYPYTNIIYKRHGEAIDVKHREQKNRVIFPTSGNTGTYPNTNIIYEHHSGELDLNHEESVSRVIFTISGERPNVNIDYHRDIQDGLLSVKTKMFKNQSPLCGNTGL